jgi:3-phenylpropionate/trans-cinnamate dioxygenase ferredoxin reductase component
VPVMESALIASRVGKKEFRKRPATPEPVAALAENLGVPLSKCSFESNREKVTMTDARTFIIVGASLAGAKAAQTLRDEGFDGKVILLGDEPVRPYERPPLSKEYLQGKADLDKVFVHDEDYYEKHDIDLRESTHVQALDPSKQEVVLASGEHLAYDALLLTTGAEPRHLTVPGSDLEGVLYLRTVADSDRLQSAIRAAGRVVVIGGGWIGCEVAASARQLGAEVVVVEAADLPLERALGPELGAFYRDVHADHGVEWCLGHGVAELRGSPRADEVRLVDDTVVRGDLIVVGVGVTPRTALAEEAGLKLENGVATDEFLESSVPGVFAAGDLANAWHPLLNARIRLEHWSAALNQGPVAAKNMLGTPTPYEKIPYFFSDQYDVGMEYSGYAVDWDQIVYRGDPGTREFVAFWLKGDRLLAGMAVNIWDMADPIADLVAAQRPVDVSRLRDPDVELANVVQ